MAVRLGEYKAHYWTWSNSWEEFRQVRFPLNSSTLFLSSSFALPHPPPLSLLIALKHTNTLAVAGVILRAAHQLTAVYISVMNINEEPPHKRMYIIHQPDDLFVQTPVEIPPPPQIYISSLPACSFGIIALRHNYINSVRIKNINRNVKSGT